MNISLFSISSPSPWRGDRPKGGKRRWSEVGDGEGGKMLSRRRYTGVYSRGEASQAGKGTMKDVMIFCFPRRRDTARWQFQFNTEENLDFYTLETTRPLEQLGRGIYRDLFCRGRGKRLNRALREKGAWTA